MSTTMSSTPSTTTATSTDAPTPAAMPPPALPPSAATETTAPTATSPLSELQKLRNHIQTLTDLNNRLQALRSIPAHLLRPPVSGVHALPQSSLLRHEFQELKEIADSVRSEKVQEALKAARKSETAEPKILGFDLGLRTYNHTRRTTVPRRPPSPESPQPYRATGPKSSSFLPHGGAGVDPVRLTGLPAYVREHNRTSQHKLHIVAPKKGRPLQCPIVLRFVIVDVVVVYLTLERASADDESLVVENATAFGPREQNAMHSQPDYTVYQQLSQQLARVLQAEPWAPLQAIVVGTTHSTTTQVSNGGFTALPAPTAVQSLLCAYDNLFTDPCTVCDRVLSADVYTPPVVRVRKEPTTESPSEWGVHHVACKWR
ncbi:hypothetical protein C8Q78DRAFT_1075193 [Trametes maxima]|nr:hypothetical protein C8Q78DRAFT_1075193 [Trametes maxima]